MTHCSKAGKRKQNKENMNEFVQGARTNGRVENKILVMDVQKDYIWWLK